MTDKCKICGDEIPTTEFDQFFAKRPDTCESCSKKVAEEKRKAEEKEQAGHPEWYGPVNQSEPY